MLSAGDTSRRVLPGSTSTPRPLRHHSTGNSRPIPTLSSMSAEPRHKRRPAKAASQHIWIVTGPAGCGKTTVAQKLATELGLPYIEGDDYHSASNKYKMASGEPLTDADRWDWLAQLREAAVDTLSSSSVTSSAEDPSPPFGVVVTCSALKSKYRDVIRAASSPPSAARNSHRQHGSVHVHFVYLRADEQTLLKRVAQRQGHYMKSNMVQSQLALLEEPGPRESDVLSIDCAAEPEVVQARVNRAVSEKLAEYR